MRGHVGPQRGAPPERLAAIAARELALAGVRHLRKREGEMET